MASPNNNNSSSMAGVEQSNNDSSSNNNQLLLTPPPSSIQNEQKSNNTPILVQTTINNNTNTPTTNNNNHPPLLSLPQSPTITKNLEKYNNTSTTTMNSSNKSPRSSTSASAVKRKIWASALEKSKVGQPDHWSFRLLGRGIDADTITSRLKDSWTALGVVAALTASMSVTSLFENDEKGALLLLCLSISFGFAVYVVVMTTVYTASINQMCSEEMIGTFIITFQQDFHMTTVVPFQISLSFLMAAVSIHTCETNLPWVTELTAQISIMPKFLIPLIFQPIFFFYISRDSFKRYSQHSIMAQQLHDQFLLEHNERKLNPAYSLSWEGTTTNNSSTSMDMKSNHPYYNNSTIPTSPSQTTLLTAHNSSDGSHHHHHHGGDETFSQLEHSNSTRRRALARCVVM
jgi:hypothetical protein